MVTVDVEIENSMDYSLVGTAVRIEGLPPSTAPIVSTVPALEFIKLLEAGIVPVGLAVGARFQWSNGPLDAGKSYGWRNNQALTQTTAFWERIRRSAHADLRADAARQGTGVLAQLQFSQLFMVEKPEPGRLLGRHIVIGTVVDCKEGATFDHPIELVLDLSGKPDNLRAGSVHHNSYADGI
jgi:hypothetical protein